MSRVEETLHRLAVHRPSPELPEMRTRTGSRLRIMDVATGKIDDRFGGFEGNARDVFFTSDGKTLVTADRHGRAAAVRVWDVATGKVVRSFPAAWKPEGWVMRSRLSPDGTVLAVLYQEVPRGLVPPGSPSNPR
jgi:WD40 repeat protein